MKRTFCMLIALAIGGGTMTAQDAEGGAVVETVGAGAAALGVAGPLTVAEATGYVRSGRVAEVAAFLDALESLPHADRLARFAFGRSSSGRALEVVVARREAVRQQDETHDLAAEARSVLADGKLRLLVLANIHAGEVEGKEVAQILLREIASGAHEDLLERATILVVPVYNADGNEPVSVLNRVEQNGPAEGVGRRENGQGFDLNRDFVKAESPECRALLGLLNAFDPHLLIDLHTTNGSRHAYHLTYSTSLATNVDDDLATFAREEWLPQLRRRVYDRWLYRTFDYGNWSAGAGWESFDHRARYGTNYFGLRNRLALLSEAYSCCDFETRVRATRAFVLEALRLTVASGDRIRRLCDEADRSAEKGEVAFRHDTALIEPRDEAVLIAELEAKEVEGGTRHAVLPGMEAVTMPVRARFLSRAAHPLPQAWAILDPAPEVPKTLELHGIVTRRLAVAETWEVETFAVEEVKRAERAFQGHHEVVVTGERRRATLTLPAGTLVVPRQKLARLAAQLLEPLSEDSLTTWEILAPRLDDGRHPVLRLIAEVAAGG